MFTETEHRTVHALAKEGLTVDDIARVLHVKTETLRDHFWDVLKDRGLVSGKKPLFFTDEKRQQVRMMAAFGIPQQKVAEFFGVELSTLREHFASEWRTAPVEMVVRVANSMVRAALNGSVTAGKFILSSRGFGAWHESSQVEHVLGVQQGADLDVSRMTDEQLDAMKAFALQAGLAASGAAPTNAPQLVKVEVEETPVSNHAGSNGNGNGANGHAAERGVESDVGGGAPTSAGDVREPDPPAESDREGSS